MGLLQSPRLTEASVLVCHGQLPVPSPALAHQSPVALPAVVHANENRFRVQTSFAPTTNRIHPHGVARSPDRATGQESYGQRLPQGQETRASVEHTQTLTRTVLIPGESRNPPVNSRRANEARTSARSCGVSISLHHRPLMRTVFTRSVEAIRLMTS